MLGSYEECLAAVLRGFENQKRMTTMSSITVTMTEEQYRRMKEGLQQKRDFYFENLVFVGDPPVTVKRVQFTFEQEEKPDASQL
jgi:hypothetical protein